MKIENSKIFVVVPTIREHSISRFLKEWQTLFRQNQIHLVVVEDNPEPTFNIPIIRGYRMSHFTWQDIEKDLGKDAWIIPRRTSAVKAYGFWKAYEMGAETIMVLDDDCYPPAAYKLGSEFSYDPIKKHIQNLYASELKEDGWISSIQKLRPRGLPYKSAKRDISSKIILSHGLWANIPDLNGKTQLKMGGKTKFNLRSYFINQILPRGVFFPMCGMNLAWKRELTPAMHFMLMGKNSKSQPWGFDRFDDIWAGVFAKKIIDALDKRVVSGHPVIWHDRASDPKVNFAKEKPGLPVNEEIWRAVDELELKSGDVKSMYKEIAKRLPMKGKYWAKQKRAMQIWADLF